VNLCTLRNSSEPLDIPSVLQSACVYSFRISSYGSYSPCSICNLNEVMLGKSRLVEDGIRCYHCGRTHVQIALYGIYIQEAIATNFNGAGKKTYLLKCIQEFHLLHAAKLQSILCRFSTFQVHMLIVESR
jgi:hypothetical protein